VRDVRGLQDRYRGCKGNCLAACAGTEADGGAGETSVVHRHETQFAVERQQQRWRDFKQPVRIDFGKQHDDMSLNAHSNGAAGNGVRQTATLSAPP
jgi:hypothetical protein